MRRAIWVDPGKGSYIFTCQVNRYMSWVELGSNRDRLCSNWSPWPLYHAVSVFCLLCWWINGGYHWATGLYLTGDWTDLLWTVGAKILTRELPWKSCCGKLCFTCLSIELVGDSYWGYWNIIILTRQIGEFYPTANLVYAKNDNHGW